MLYGYIKNRPDNFTPLLPICCFIGIFFALSYWEKISNDMWHQEHRELLNRLTVTYAVQIENQIDRTLLPHDAIEKRLIKQQGKLDGFNEHINRLLIHHRDILRLSFSPNATTAIVFPTANNQHLIGQKITPPSSHPNFTTSGLSPHKTFYSPPIKQSNGKILFSVNHPVFIDDKFWGYISYQINAADIASQVQLPQAVANKYSYQLSHIGADQKLTLLAQSTSPLGREVYSASISVPEHNWLLEVSYDNRGVSSLKTLGVLFRLLVSSVITLIIYWASLEPRRLRRKLKNEKEKLANNSNLLQSVLDNINDGVIVSDNSGKIQLINNSARKIYKVDHHKTLDINSQCFQCYTDEDSKIGPCDGLFHKALYRNQESQQEVVLAADDGLACSLKTQSKILFDANNVAKGAMLLVQDITELKQITNANTSRNIILDMLAHDKPINEIFNHIINEVEQNFDQLSGAILLLDNQKRHFIDVVAPKLPSFFTESLDGIEIGERVMSCGSAIYHDKMIVVEDVQTHPYWIGYKDLAAQANIGSSWSQPIHSANGELLGCFDIYSSQENPATPARILALKEAATLTALTIERHRDGQRLRKISLAVQHSPNALVIIDKQGAIDYVNPKFCKITGYQSVELIGQPLNILIPKTDNQALYQEVLRAVKAGKDWRGEIKSTKKNGDDYWAYDHVSAIKDDSGKIKKFVIVQEDITENRRQSEPLNYQQNNDLLTGLVNTHYFDSKTQRAVQLARNSASQHALCLIDLDNFKRVNQDCGPLAGDEFLRQVSTIFRGHLRQRDTLARLNSDQFAILMKDCSSEPAKRCCNELIQLLANHTFTWQEHRISISASIGITTIDHTTADCDEAMKQADMACFSAKSSGGNQARLYQRKDHKNIALYGDAHRAQDIRDALKNDKFKLFAQPIVSLTQTSDNIDLEILLRLEQDNKTLLLPEAFLPTAQRYNLAKKLDLWVIEHSIAWFNEHPYLLDTINGIAINLSSSSFEDESQLLAIINLLEKNRHIAQHLVFEVTEYTVVSNLSKAYNFMSALKKFKVRFTLDNFGKGYLSFCQLKNIPISTINIDGRLINEIADNKISAVMVKSICEVAHIMAIKTVAKQVENEALIAVLQTLPIDAIQGYSQGVPVNIDTLKDSHFIPNRVTSSQIL